jgi:methionyl-tRNA synthetase
LDLVASLVYDWYCLANIEYLQYETGKFSKSRGVGVFGNNVVDSGIPVEVWRYYLLSNRPETSDAQFTWKNFQMANNSELLANLGNFVNRIMKFVTAKYDGVMPKATVTVAEETLIKDINVLLKSYIQALDGVKIRLGIKIAMEISSRGNAYLQENKIDNALFESNRERCDTVLNVSLNLTYLISSLIYPYMPSSTDAILRMLKVPLRKITDTWAGGDIYAGHTLGKPEYLFKSIGDEKMEECLRLYSGQNDAKVEAPPAKGSKKKKSEKPVVKAVELTPEMKIVQEKIDVQGGLVRKLKGEKAEAGLIKSAVESLLALKKELAALQA